MRADDQTFTNFIGVYACKGLGHERSGLAGRDDAHGTFTECRRTRGLVQSALDEHRRSGGVNRTARDC
jgi:hypothetical protein